MTPMIREVYDAFDRLDGLGGRGRLLILRGIEDRLTRIEERLRRVEADVLVMKWMLGFVLALGVANLGLLIRLALSGVT